MLRRMTDARRALLRKLENVDAFPLIALQALRELRSDLDAVEAEAILRARDLGASLGDIADAMEITRQGVAYKLKALSGNGHADEAAGDADDEIVDVRESDSESHGSTASS
jgi:DNA-binding MarR family transcriptional regulator